ncbi:MAG: serine/threonine-protein kinase [Vicinamibacterales bacterium]
MIGTTLDRYRVLASLGHGGMGEVYKALDTSLEREVAIKVLRPEFIETTEVLRRFRSEAMTLAKLSHPGIATLYEFKQEGELVYMVMELVHGETVERWRERQGRLGWSEVAEVARQVLGALEYAHRQGVVHRDIKPSNLMVAEHGLVKVMDFGIARVLGGVQATRTGHVVGTIEYMAPEQVTGKAVDGRTDLYALGIVMYELVAGDVPFRAATDYAYMKAHLESPVPSLRAKAPDVPEWFEQVILRLLAKAPDARFPDATACRQAIERGSHTSRSAGPALLSATPLTGSHAEEDDPPTVDLGRAKATRLGSDTVAPVAPLVAAAVVVPPIPGEVRPQAEAARQAPPIAWTWQHVAAAAAITAIVGAPMVWWWLSPGPVRPGAGRAAAPSSAVAPRTGTVARATDRGGTSPLPAPEPGPPPIRARPLPEPDPPPAPSPRVPTAPPVRARPSVPTPLPAPTPPPVPEAPPPVDDRPASTETKPAPAPLKPVTFDKVRYLATVQGKTREVDVRLALTPDRLDILESGSTKRLQSVAYHAVDGATYTNARRPKSASSSGAVAILTAPIMLFSGPKHWLSIESGTDVIVLRLDKENYRSVIPAFEARAGVKVISAGDEKDEKEDGAVGANGASRPAARRGTPTSR